MDGNVRLMTATPRSHADTVRQRRNQQAQQRRQSTRAAVVGPLVSRPRLTGRGSLPKPAAAASARRRFEIAFAGAARSWPALTHVSATARMASLALVILLAAILVKLLVEPGLFINGINLGGSKLVPGEEIYAAAGIARQHIFWVDPLTVQQNVAALPGLAAATVSVKWPNQVTIVVAERVPVVTWIEGADTWWVDSGGHKFPAREGLPGLLPITVDDLTATPLGENNPVPVAVVLGALQLRQLRPNIEMLHYDTLRGLSYQDGRDWRGYFGVGTEMAQKLAVYETLVDNLTRRGVHPALISVEAVNAPYYRR